MSRPDIRPMFRGEPWQETVIVPVDPSRPHRFGESHLDTRCWFCDRGRGDSIHDSAAVQRTFQRRSEYE